MNNRAAVPVPTPRARFLSALGVACDQRRPFAAGKLGVTERSILSYPLVLEQQPDDRSRRAFELLMRYRALRAAGIFPAEKAFHREWAPFYASQVAALDSIGFELSRRAETALLLSRHGIDNDRLIEHKHQQPDRSTPSEPEHCYLQFLAGRDVLLVCPFAEFLAQRADRDTFERVWAKTGKRWFGPRTVQALELPYGFAPETQARYRSSLELLEELQGTIAARRFDVALIAAGGLGIPLAAFVRSRGLIGLSLGGHLQVLFGVLGERWRSREHWQERYFNDAWVALPDRYVPPAGQTTEDYW
jgi:hypothetical protein